MADGKKVADPILKSHTLREFTNFDLSLISQFEPNEGSSNSEEKKLCLRLMYNLNRYTNTSANEVLLRFEPSLVLFSTFRLKSLLLNLVSSMEMNTLLGNIPVTSEAEYKQILDEWNDTATPEFISEDLISDRFREIMKNSPDSVALVIAEEQVTFRELDRRSDVLAAFLTSVGVTSESMVAVCLHRSIELIVALVGMFLVVNSSNSLGIIKCGASYVPIDPTYPETRRNYILNDSKAKLLLSSHDIEGLFGETRTVTTIFLDAHWKAIEASSSEIIQKKTYASRPLANAKNSMYVIYTSGSTGNPKGVVLQHRGLTNRLLSMAQLLHTEKEKKLTALRLAAAEDHVEDIENVGAKSLPRLNPAWREHRILQKTSVCFDVSVWELFLSLVTGCCMVLLEAQQEKDPRAIVDAIDTQSISMLHFVPTMLSAFVASGKEDISNRCSSLDFVVTSGEALDVSSASTIQVC